MGWLACIIDLEQAPAMKLNIHISARSFVSMNPSQLGMFLDQRCPYEGRHHNTMYHSLLRTLVTSGISGTTRKLGSVTESQW
jgi:hypothetical protein